MCVHERRGVRLHRACPEAVMTPSAKGCLPLSLINRVFARLFLSFSSSSVQSSPPQMFNFVQQKRMVRSVTGVGTPGAKNDGVRVTNFVLRLISQAFTVALTGPASSPYS